MHIFIYKQCITFSKLKPNCKIIHLLMHLYLLTNVFQIIYIKISQRLKNLLVHNSFLLLNYENPWRGHNKNLKGRHLALETTSANIINTRYKRIYKVSTYQFMKKCNNQYFHCKDNGTFFYIAHIDSRSSFCYHILLKNYYCLSVVQFVDISALIFIHDI